MNLAIDIGNSYVKYGLFEKNELREVRGEDITIGKIISKYKIERAIISRSGSGSKLRAIEKTLKAKKIKTLVLSHKTKLPIKILYKTPETLGADRVAGSVAASFLFPKKNILKIDFGTCITYDFVNSKKQYIGGAISPGVFMRFRAMHEFTSSLDFIMPWNIDSHELIGTDSYSSLASGGINGITYEVDGIIKEYKKRFGNLKVVATGRDAGRFVTLLNCEIFARPNLVLEGLNRILNYNASK